MSRAECSDCLYNPCSRTSGTGYHRGCSAFSVAATLSARQTRCESQGSSGQIFQFPLFMVWEQKRAKHSSSSSCLTCLLLGKRTGLCHSLAIALAMSASVTTVSGLASAPDGCGDVSVPIGISAGFMFHFKQHQGKGHECVPVSGPLDSQIHSGSHLFVCPVRA